MSSTPAARLKYQRFDTKTRRGSRKGNCERIGIDGSSVATRAWRREARGGFARPQGCREVRLPDLDEAGFDTSAIEGTVTAWFRWLVLPRVQGRHRRDAGWVREVAPSAPLHNSRRGRRHRDSLRHVPSIGNVIVADTSLHYNIPLEKAWRYALPRDVATSCTSASTARTALSPLHLAHHTSQFLNADVQAGLLATGSGACSLPSSYDMDTTLGLTPLDGLIMGTCCGTIDPATVCYLVREGGYTIDEVDTMMNKQSGSANFRQLPSTP